MPYSTVLTQIEPPSLRAVAAHPDVRWAALLALAPLLLLAGCGDAGGAAEAADSAPAAVESALADRRPPRPDYTDAELAALAQSPEVTAMNLPFGATPAPDRQLHVPMSDGTRIAVSLYFPAGFDPAADKAPLAYVETWYGRTAEATMTAIDLYRAGGFVVAIVDPRGFGASFGAQATFLSDDVRRDQRELAAWFAAQSWSNGRIVAVGLSVSAAHAEAMAASGAPAIGAAIIRASDFDQYSNNVFPGGVPNPRIIGLVDEVMTWMRGEPCLADPAVCPLLGIAPVDGDGDFSLLRAAFGDHQANVSGSVLSSLVFRDDTVGAASFSSMNASDHVEALRAAALPARVSASWLDGTTADSALARFRALPDVPMQVVIGTTTHSGGLDADPFSRTPFGAARPPAAQQFAADVDFARRALAGEAIGRSVSYYVLGAGVWRTTPAWPPAGTELRTFTLGRDELVSRGHVRSGEVAYQVDETVSSRAAFNRWASQSNAPVYYGDRRFTAGRRLSFQSAPVERDTEVLGAPELCLAMRTDQPDGLVVATLEDVAPDGRVTYLTEGELRLLHRKTASGGCDPAPGTARTFRAADGAAVTPGEMMRVELPLLTTAALVRRGHRVRLSLAGADAGTFPTLTSAPATWSVAYGTGGSTLRLPVR